MSENENDEVEAHGHDVDVNDLPPGTKLCLGCNHYHEEKHYHICVINQPSTSAIASDSVATSSGDESFEDDLLHYTNVILGRLDFSAVPLEITREIIAATENFGESRLSIFQLRGDNSKSLSLENIFTSAKEYAEKEAETNFRNQAAIDDHVERHGNVVGLVGIGGIGKSTLAMQFIDFIRDRPGNPLVFHLSLKIFDCSQKMSLLEFLTKQSHPKLKHTQENDAKILAKLDESIDVYIILDSFDEMRVKKDPLPSPFISLYEKATPDVILKNLLKGNLLPKAKKLLLSRPGVYHDLHPDDKPHMTGVVTGLSEESQKMLIQQNYPNQKERILAALGKNPSAKSLCFIPIYAKTIASFIAKQNVEVKSFTLTEVFTSFLEDCVRSPRFKQTTFDLLKLAHLAFDGMKRRTFTFDKKFLQKHGIDVGQFDEFIQMFVSLSNSNLRILDGDLLFFFIHLLWQEYFASVKLMFGTDLQTFSDFLPTLQSKEWEMVLHFLFGFLSSDVQPKLAAINLTSDDLTEKRAKLKDLLLSMESDYLETSYHDCPIFFLSAYYDLEKSKQWGKFRKRAEDRCLFMICSLAHESKDDDIIQSVASSLPEMILLSKTILPSDVASLCLVLRATDKQITINVGVSYIEPAEFTGDGLKMFMDEVAQTTHLIKKFHALNLDENTTASILKYVPKMQELTVRKGNLSSDEIHLLVEQLQKRDEQIEFLSLGWNNMNDASVKLLSGCISMIKTLFVMECQLTSNQIEMLAKSINALQKPMYCLNFGDNFLESHDLCYLASCVVNIKVLWLARCNVSGSDLNVLTNAIIQLEKPMKAFNLNGNLIGAAGLANIATCVHNIDNLILNDCKISGEDLGVLTQAIAARTTPMERLEIFSDTIGDFGARYLATCFHKINYLVYKDDNIDSIGKKELEAPKKRPKFLCRVM